ncbi:MAG: GtrA family protein [Nanoarchaeota archaeon]|nr:GtrA family protein [Nanoarchaeota archaeon]
MGLKKKFLSFCFAGASGALLELASFNIFFIFLTFMPSKILSLALALALNFSINRNITFLARSGKITKQFTKYLVVYAIAIVVNLSVSLLMNNFLGNGAINANIATASGIATAIPITFLGSLHWVFKDKIPKN